MPLTNTSNTIVNEIVDKLLASLHPDIRAHYEAGEAAKARRDARTYEGVHGRRNLPPSFLKNIKKKKKGAKDDDDEDDKKLPDFLKKKRKK